MNKEFAKRVILNTAKGIPTKKYVHRVIEMVDGKPILRQITEANDDILPNIIVCKTREDIEISNRLTEEEIENLTLQPF